MSPNTLPPQTTMLRPRPAIVTVLMGAMALPSLAIDMYLPSLPEISAVFGVHVGITQLTLTLFLVMLGIGQLVAGPVSDAVGRRGPLLAGCVIFVAGSVLAALSPGIGTLIAARLLQGAGGSLVVVVANSSVRDLSSGEGTTQLYALMMGVVGIAPILAPTIGGYLDVAFGWRSVFWLLTGLGAVLIVGVLALLPETLPPGGRSPLRLGATFATYRDLVRNPGFAYPAVALIAMFGLLFSYIGGSSYVYQGAFGLTPSAFGLAFGACGVAMMFATLAVHRLAARFGSVRLALAGGTIALAGSLGAAVLVVANAPFAGFLAAIVAVAFGIGLTEPALMGRAMAAPKRGTGQAAALLGSAQFLLGAAATAIAGIVAAQGALPWTLLLALFAAVVLALTWAGARGARATPANGEIPSPRAR